MMAVKLESKIQIAYSRIGFQLGTIQIKQAHLTCMMLQEIQHMTLPNWKILTQTASADAPTALTADGRLWYSSTVDEVDILVPTVQTL